MPELLANFAPAAIDGGADLFAGAASAAPDVFGGGAALGGDLAAAGLPFAPGMGQIGATAADLGMSAGAFGGGLPFAAGAGADLAGLAGGLGTSFADGGAAFAGGGADLAGMVTSNASLTSPSSTPFGAGAPDLSQGVTGVGGVSSTGGTATPGIGPTAPTATAAVPGAAAPAGAAPLDLTSALTKAIGNTNPLGAALGAAGLGYTIMQGQKQSGATQAIQDQASKVAGTAADVTSQGKSLVSHLESGSLPPNIQAQVDTNTKAAKTKIISNYAAQGMNTDPNHNSSLRQELAAVDQQSKVLSGQLAQQLAASGTNLISAGTALTGLDNNLLTTLSNIDQTQTQRMGSAIANFAAALNGNKGGINLKIA